MSSRVFSDSIGVNKPYSYRTPLYLDQEARSPIGTKRYMSRNVLMGDTPSRRDDIISCLYILCYFRSGGQLPWCQLDKKYPHKNPREIREIAIHKRRIDGKFRNFYDGVKIESLQKIF